MRRVLLVLVGVLALAGCGKDANDVKPRNLRGVTVTLPDGRKVDCIVFLDRDADSGASGLSCDWPITYREAVG